MRLIIIFLLINASVKGQEAHFSQFYASPLHLNPALASLEKNVYLGLNYRNQWRSLGTAQQTSQLAAIVPVNCRQKSLGSGGITVFSDVLGESNSYRSNGVTLSFSRQFYRKGGHLFSAGVQGGLTNKRLDASGLQWGSQYDPYLGFNASLSPTIDQLVTQRVYSVVNTGLLWLYSGTISDGQASWQSYAGISLANLNQPNESMIVGEKNNLPVLLKLHGGVLIRLSPKISVSPNWLWMRQHQAKQLNTGAYLNYQLTTSYRGAATPLQLSLGCWYRRQDAYILSAGASSKGYTIGFSYDMNVSSLRYGTSGRGAYEFSIAYRLAGKDSGIRHYATPLM